MENLKSRQTKESLRKLNQMDFDPHDVTKEEIDEITKNPIFDENNISDFILNEYGVEKRNIILVIILRFCSKAFYRCKKNRKGSVLNSVKKTIFAWGSSFCFFRVSFKQNPL